VIGDSLAPALAPARWRVLTVTSITSVTVVAAAVVWRFGWTRPLAAYLYLGAVLTVSAVIDAHTFTTPN